MSGKITFSPPTRVGDAELGKDAAESRCDDAPAPTPLEYTSFTSSQRRQLRPLLGLAAITSPLTATIYFPILPLLRTQFSTSAQAINFTITLYIVFQAISPVIFGPLSDVHGRRPYFLATLALYVIGNLGLALNKRNYVVLLVLRAIQSLGASAAYAISFGVVADVCVPSERGQMLGPISMAMNLGTCIGPVVGGVVAYTSGNINLVFWALFVVGGVLLVGVGTLLPETARNMVGNGSKKSGYKWWQYSWVGLLRKRIKVKATKRLNEGSSTAESPVATECQTTKRKYGFFDLFACFRIIFYRDTFLTLWVHGSFYIVDYTFVAAGPDIYKDIYHWNELYIGLSYLPRGIGTIAGAYFTGKMMDHNYRAIARSIGWTIDKVSGDDLLKFPIERARTRYSYVMLIISVATTIGYGWSVQYHAHPAVPLILQFLQGFWGCYGYTTFSTLLVDSFPQSPSTAAAATSITRCAMAATGVAVLQPLLNAAGRGWYFTALGLWSGMLSALCVALLRWKGMHWRQVRNGPLSHHASLATGPHILTETKSGK
ncbi:major facilitator superfamily domain-containing protein [Alternaria rosae]|uniref:major facilitator superfamily domain-containing protein n=1 Tax=Alternaria rosae TaxID=1187941 RepID=UPI001E8EE514|nr:major facilitator superfamily domain-containing protein [Alternaria rosae]KAH6865488.1 major facilitator superfamily domain-containing protein [Alternaria rosae]